MKSVTKRLLATTALTIVPFAALAAPQAPLMTTFSWSGLYVGADAGWAGTNNKFTSAGDIIGSANKHGSTGVFGALIGFNQQFGSFVLGLEADLSNANFSKAYFRDVRFSGENGWDKSTGLEGTVRARFGYAFDHFLLFATGGIAFANVRSTDTVMVDGRYYSARYSNNYVGWTLGAGFEYALSQLWAIRGEYRYSDFGTVGNTFPGVFFNETSKHHLTSNAVTLGVTYKLTTN